MRKQAQTECIWQLTGGSKSDSQSETKTPAR
jgi:hypothetical protein